MATAVLATIPMVTKASDPLTTHLVEGNAYARSTAVAITSLVLLLLAITMRLLLLATSHHVLEPDTLIPRQVINLFLGRHRHSQFEEDTHDNRTLPRASTLLDLAESGSEPARIHQTSDLSCLVESLPGEPRSVCTRPSIASAHLRAIRYIALLSPPLAP